VADHPNGAEMAWVVGCSAALLIGLAADWQERTDDEERTDESGQRSVVLALPHDGRRAGSDNEVVGLAWAFAGAFCGVVLVAVGAASYGG
jgi:hypothetical protein